MKWTQSGWIEVDSKTCATIEASLQITLHASLQAFDINSTEPFVWRHSSKVVVLVKASTDSNKPIVVATLLPDENISIVCSLISAHIEALKNRFDATEARNQVESYIDQVN